MAVFQNFFEIVITFYFYEFLQKKTVEEMMFLNHPYKILKLIVRHRALYKWFDKKQFYKQPSERRIKYYKRVI